MQRLKQIVFVVKLQTSHEISHRKNHFELGQHFQAHGHSFLPYGPPTRQMKYIYFINSKHSNFYF